MRIDQLLQGTAPTFSFEIYPPKTEEGGKNLLANLKPLVGSKIDFISVTAGPDSLQRTIDWATILMDLGFTPLVHLTCHHTIPEMNAILAILERIGVENVLILRGDGFVKPKINGFRSARQLVEFTRKEYNFCIGSAGYPESHPEAGNASRDLRNLTQKLDAGADWILTQMFFVNSAFDQLGERLRETGYKQPILPGLMPLQEEVNLERFATYGATVPAGLLTAFQAATDPKEARRVGLEFAIRQSRELLAAGAPGIHLYTMNRLTMIPKVLAAIHD